MKLLPFLLYVVALGLFGLAGWTVYQMLPLWKSEVRDQAQRQGQNDGNDRLSKGRAQGPQSSNWVYNGDTQPWWEGLKKLNVIGKLPPVVVPVDTASQPPPPPPVDTRPLEQVIEIVSLVYDGQFGGKGGNSHAILRFKPEANVQPPEWWVKENTAPTANVAAGPGPRDVAKPLPGRPAPPPPANRPAAPRPVATPLPTGPGGREILQRAWVVDNGDPRRSATLWPVKTIDGKDLGTIRLVRVAPDAESAWFVREMPPGAAGAAAEPKEEELIRTTGELSQDVLRELRALRGDRRPVRPSTETPAAGDTKWVDTEETVLVGSVRHIGRKDAERFRDGADDLLDSLNVDNYVSTKSNGVRGLIVKGVDPKLAASFGVGVGEVLLEINGRKVESKAQAVSQVKGDYKRGVRTFATKWLVNGEVVDRTIQAPDK
jgi:hypothetical protein